MKALICYNPKSGKQKFNKNLEYIKSTLHTKYDLVDVYETTGVGSLTTYLKEVAKNYDFILFSGGDGTFNEVITGVIEANAKPKLGYIPGGTCNDIGSMLKIPHNIKKALKLILNEEAVEMDICKADEKYFAYVFGIGKFIDISYTTPSKLKHYFGRIAYFYSGFKEFLQKIKMHVEIDTPVTSVKGGYYVVLGLNSNHVAGFKIFRKKQVKLNDGHFDLTLIQKKGVSWPRLFMFMLLGDLALKYGITTITTNEVKLKFAEPLSCNTDGEFAFRKSGCEIKCLPKAIKIVVPKKTKDKFF